MWKTKHYGEWDPSQVYDYSTGSDIMFSSKCSTKSIHYGYIAHLEYIYIHTYIHRLYTCVCVHVCVYTLGSGEVAQWLRALDVFVKDLSSVPGTHLAKLSTTGNSKSKESDTFSAFCINIPKYLRYMLWIAEFDSRTATRKWHRFEPCNYQLGCRFFLPAWAKVEKAPCVPLSSSLWCSLFTFLTGSKTPSKTYRVGLPQHFSKTCLWLCISARTRSRESEFAGDGPESWLRLWNIDCPNSLLLLWGQADWHCVHKALFHLKAAVPRSRWALAKLGS
jgi:hypothetical protein